jgi:hypothetical protein
MISVGGELITGVLGFIKVIFDDFKPFIILVIGIFFGFWIIEEIVDMVEDSLASRRAAAEKLAAISSSEEKKIFAPYHERQKELEIKEFREGLFHED